MITIIQYQTQDISQVRMVTYYADYSTSKVVVDDEVVELASSPDNISANIRLYIDDTGFYYLPFGGIWSATYIAFE